MERIGEVNGISYGLWNVVVCFGLGRKSKLLIKVVFKFKINLKVVLYN